MPSKKESIERFKSNIDELISSSYIMSQKKLSTLMKGISTSKLFYELFSYCTEDFDYLKAKEKAFKIGDSYGSGTYHKLPDVKSQVAFTFSLLCEIDSGDVDFLKLLEQYFFVQDYDDSYRNFAMQVLIPFKDEVLRGAEAILNNSDVKPNATITKASAPAISQDDANKIKTLLDQTKSVILQYKIDNQLKAELMILYDNFQSALYDTETEKIKVAFLGYKYATYFHRKLDLSVGKIESILKACKVL